MNSKEFQLGCEVFLQDPPSWFRNRRLGLLVNQASVSQTLEHVSDLILSAEGNLTCLFSPQHGFYGEKQANMRESSDGWDSFRGVPVFSLYGDVRQPTPEMLERIDVLLIDLQDVGTRVYTYAITMGLCLESAANAGIKVVVMDRPNPINGKQIEGNLLREDHRSFVGRYPIPMRHGLTMGEMARYMVRKCHIPCDLEVIPLKGWRRRDFFSETKMQWVFPSPNMPSWETALLYPGMVLLEGTNVSEGRGTTLPFHIFGSPFLDQKKFNDCLKRSELKGVFFRPICFEPVFDKYVGELCYGFQIHITDRKSFRPYRLGLVLLETFIHVHGDDFRWTPPPYEYEWEKLPIDILLGDGTLRKRLEDGADIKELESGWEQELRAYRSECKDCLLYPE